MSFPFPVVQAGEESRLQGYESVDKLGEGKYADVHKGRRKTDGQLVIVKNIKIFDMPSNERKECVNEAKLLSSVQQSNIIQCYDAFIEGNELIMILELTDGGNLAQLIAHRKACQTRFSEQDLWTFIYFISLGLAHMHSKRIMHRDIKPSNVHITTKGEIKLGDLGLGRIFSSVTDYAASLVGTPYYMSPELIQGEQYNYKSDVWSLGCLLYELSMLRLPFSDETGSFYHLGKKIIDCDYSPVEAEYSLSFRNLIHSMIQKDSGARPTAEGVVTIAKNYVSSHLVVSGEEKKGQEGCQDTNPSSDYELLQVIGRGKYSTVHKAKQISTGGFLAVKKVQIFDMDTDGRNEVINEARLLQSLPEHPNIIKYMASFIENNELYLMLELAQAGDFSQIITDHRRNKQPFSEAEIWYYFVQICGAVRQMHICRVMHRDIKPANILLTAEGQVVKLGDLGLGKYFSSKTVETFSMVGTPYYMSPEAIANTGYSFKSDVWSLGVVLYEIAALRTPFYSEELNYYTLGQQITKASYAPIPSHYSQYLHDLIHMMILPDPTSRADIDTVYNLAVQAYQHFHPQQAHQTQ